MKLFDSGILSEFLNSEKDNHYNYLIEEPSASFYASQNGKEAYNFEEETILGEQFNLACLKAKVVFIDV